MNWIKAHSAIWQHFHRKYVPTFPCGFCQTPFATPSERHVIGQCFHGNGISHRAFLKLCDGTEVPQ